MGIWTYSPSSVHVLIAGLYQIEGFSNSDFVKISKDSPFYNTRKSADGIVSRSYVTEEVFKIELTIAQSSPSNTVLSKIVAIDQMTQMGVFPLLIKDNSGSTFFFSTTTWINQIPEVSFGQELSARSWELIAAGGQFTIGDNAQEESSLDDLLNKFMAFAPLLKNILQ